MAVAGLGLGPWEVFHQRIARITGLPLGTVTSLLGVPMVFAWLPLGERPGIGTVLNIALICLATNAPLAGLPDITELPFQIAAMLGGVVTIAVGCGLYLRFGWSIRRARKVIEIIVIAAGFLLGGTVGLGTVVFALGIGALVQVALGVFDREGRVSRRRRALLEGDATVAE